LHPDTSKFHTNSYNTCYYYGSWARLDVKDDGEANILLITLSIEAKRETTIRRCRKMRVLTRGDIVAETETKRERERGGEREERRRRHEV
jgi:hypothetical protein